MRWKLRNPLRGTIGDVIEDVAVPGVDHSEALLSKESCRSRWSRWARCR